MGAGNCAALVQQDGAPPRAIDGRQARGIRGPVRLDAGECSDEAAGADAADERGGDALPSWRSDSRAVRRQLCLQWWLAQGGAVHSDESAVVLHRGKCGGGSTVQV
uniref:Inactive phospholipase C-like protein 1 n=1 Tax=Lygus hesperus TaxID=30085 RepID=A0A0A9WAJ6_LYGHE